MSRNRPARPLRGACGVLGAEHEALLRAIGGNLCDYCSKRGSTGCEWEATTTLARVDRQAQAPGHTRPRGQSVRHVAAEIASHLGP